ncbi:Na+/H+ antiporter subunit C [Zwartia sp.]|uniref:Na+/H+ antiporter subunit C n=1 Tax=Zwartia sp. TaxID=2978004 RepID=UPI002720E4E5|nr:Na+/H+ antiporter subunit C [Zwartia sp.]MDO9023298.1 Na+/H+ antiporter subunit C [Zwartia sp.]
MEFLLSSALGIVTACGIYLILRGRTFSVVLGLSLLGYAVNLFIFAMGRLVSGRPPVIVENAAFYADPIPQALVLTAIVIGFGMTGFIVELALRTRHDTKSDHVDGREPGREQEKGV